MCELKLHRYLGDMAICRKHGIPFSIQEKNFSSRDDTMLWMLRNQLGRRNLNSYQRVELVLKFEPLVKSATEQRMLAGKAANPVPTLAQGQTKGKTRDHLSEAAGVSHGTFAKAKKLVQSADEETKRELRAGKVTVNRAYTELLEKEHEGETKICERCKQEKPLSAFSIPSNRRSFSSVCRDCEKEISAVAKSAAEAASKSSAETSTSNPAEPCPIPGMVMRNGAPIHVETALPDTPEMFCYVADLVKSCCDSYVIGLTSAMRRYSSGMGSEEHDAQILELVRQTNAQVLTILNERLFFRTVIPKNASGNTIPAKTAGTRKDVRKPRRKPESSTRNERSRNNERSQSIRLSCWQSL